MSKKNPANCTKCNAQIYLADNVWRNFGDDAVHQCQAAAPRDRDDVIECNACGLRTRSAMIVKQIAEGRGRCVNTAACEKRQRKLAKAAT